MGTGNAGLNGRLLEVAVVIGMDEETGLEQRPLNVSYKKVKVLFKWESLEVL